MICLSTKLNTPAKGHIQLAECLQLREALPLAAWFGLFAGLVEVSLRAVQKFFLHQMIFLSPHFVWMTPLANLFLFAIAWFILAMIVWLWPRVVSLRMAIFIFAFLGFSGPFLAYPRLYALAAFLLILGLAVQTTRIIVAHAAGFRRLVRRTMGWMVAIVLGLTVTLQGWQILNARSALAKLPPAPPRAPNVLLIVLDTVRAQQLSLYGYPRLTTPQLDCLAESGVVFDRALATSSWTLPSHASMFTGHFPHELSANWLQPLDATYPTLAEVFRQHGYLTSAFVANLLYCTYESGLNRGFLRYEDYPISPGMIIRSSWVARNISNWLQGFEGHRGDLVRKSAKDINEEFLRWLSHKQKRPFFTFLNYFDAHAPYLSPKSFALKFGPQRPRPDVSVRRYWSPEEIQVELDAYNGAVAYIDHYVGLLLEEMKRTGLLDNTLVIITSDHGEQFGEHGLFDHGNSLYRAVLQVPLLISFPNHVPAGQRIQEPVTLADLPTTVMDLVKLDTFVPFPGSSLARYWNKDSKPWASETALLSEVSKGINMPAWLPIMKGDMKSLVANGYHYIRNGDGREELYDFDNDVQEEVDCTASVEGRRAIARVRALLDTMLAQNSNWFGN